MNPPTDPASANYLRHYWSWLKREHQELPWPEAFGLDEQSASILRRQADIEFKRLEHNEYEKQRFMSHAPPDPLG